MWRKRQKGLSAMALFLFVLLLFLFFQKKSEEKTEIYKRADVLMGTDFYGTVYGGNEDVLPELAERLRSLETEQLSWREESSEIGKINSASGKGLGENISEETFGYLKAILDIAKKSEGALDPTIGNVSRLWDFGGVGERLPEKEEIETGIEKTGYEKLQVENGIISLPEGMSLDLGATGKGIGADVAADFIKEQDGIEGAVIALGGSIALIGNKPDQTWWNLAIVNPRGEEGEMLGVLKLQGEHFISTSGDYEKYFMVDGKRYHHILNPHTGYPAESGLISVTIVCDSGLKSDGLSTACFVLGLEKGMELIREYGAEGILVDEEKNVYITRGLKDFFDLKDESYQIVE
ncbi:MAG: FAD:protein FMN transferase [Lachnospiraceae bacterium]|nr:FAD:protein FMN transferase [Lachnospiraceae bacterium]